MRYQTELATNVAALKAAGVDADTSDAARRCRRRSRRCAPAWPTLASAVAGAHEHAADRSRRRRTSATRSSRRWPRSATAADTLEGLVADDLWPLPTYQEMLYIL